MGECKVGLHENLVKNQKQLMIILLYIYKYCLINVETIKVFHCRKKKPNSPI